MEEPRLEMEADSEEIEEKTVPLSDRSNQLQSSSILGDRQGLLADISLKRSAEGETESEPSKSKDEGKKKRRSSLSTYRRSITGDIKPQFDLNVEVSGEPSNNQRVTESERERERLHLIPPSGTEGLLPHPRNIQMDLVIAEAKAKIERLIDESEKWQNVHQSLIGKEKESTKLVGEDVDLTLPMPDIPEEWKKEATASYIRCAPANLKDILSQCRSLVTDYYRARNSCAKDLIFLKDSICLMQTSNSVLKLNFLRSQLPEASAPPMPDPRQLIASYLQVAEEH